MLAAQQPRALAVSHCLRSFSRPRGGARRRDMLGAERAKPKETARGVSRVKARPTKNADCGLSVSTSISICLKKFEDSDLPGSASSAARLCQRLAEGFRMECAPEASSAARLCQRLAEGFRMECALEACACVRRVPPRQVLAALTGRRRTSPRSPGMDCRTFATQAPREQKRSGI